MGKTATRVNQLVRSAGIALLTAACVLSYQNCGSDFSAKDVDHLSASGELCEAALSATFATSYHPVLSTTCHACHVPGGAGKGVFASKDVGLAFKDFRFATAEKISENAVNPSHAPGVSGPALETKITQAQNEWDAAVAACKSGSPIDSNEDPIELVSTQGKLVQATTQNKTITWDLDKETLYPEGQSPKAFAGAKLALNIRTETNAAGVKVYYISNLNITTATAAVRIGQIRVAMNDKIVSVGTTYSRLDVEVPVNTRSQVLSASTMIFEYDVAATDQISLIIGVLEPR